MNKFDEELKHIVPVWQYVVRYIERLMWQNFDDRRDAIKAAVLSNEDAFLALGIPSVTFSQDAASNETIESDAQDAIQHLPAELNALGNEDKAKFLLQEWIDKQGHDRCWYYPDIFKELCQLFDVDASQMPGLPPKVEFEDGCKRYQNEQYEKKVL